MLTIFSQKNIFDFLFVFDFIEYDECYCKITNAFDFFPRFSCVPPSTVKLIPVIVYPLVDGARKTIESCKDNENRVNNKLFSLKDNVRI